MLALLEPQLNGAGVLTAIGLISSSSDSCERPSVVFCSSAIAMAMPLSQFTTPDHSRLSELDEIKPIATIDKKNSVSLNLNIITGASNAYIDALVSGLPTGATIVGSDSLPIGIINENNDVFLSQNEINEAHLKLSQNYGNSGDFKLTLKTTITNNTATSTYNHILCIHVPKTETGIPVQSISSESQVTPQTIIVADSEELMPLDLNNISGIDLISSRLDICERPSEFTTSALSRLSKLDEIKPIPSFETLEHTLGCLTVLFFTHARDDAISFDGETFTWSVFPTDNTPTNGSFFDTTISLNVTPKTLIPKGIIDFQQNITRIEVTGLKENVDFILMFPQPTPIDATLTLDNNVYTLQAIPGVYIGNPLTGQISLSLLLGKEDFSFDVKAFTQDTTTSYPSDITATYSYDFTQLLQLTPERAFKAPIPAATFNTAFQIINSLEAVNSRNSYFRDIFLTPFQKDELVKEPGFMGRIGDAVHSQHFITEADSGRAEQGLICIRNSSTG